MPYGITIVGLGPGGSQHRTRAAATVLNQAREVYLRPARYPGLADISAQIYNFDDVVTSDLDFDQMCDQIAVEIVRLGQRDQGVIYAVPGNPGPDDPAVRRIQALADRQQIPVIVIPGLGLLDAARTALNLDQTQQLQIVEAAAVARLYHPPLVPDQLALVVHLYRPTLATAVKQTLLNAYPDDLTVALVQFPGDGTEQVHSCPLATLDWQPYFDFQTMLYLPAEATYRSFTTFQETIAHLRAPDGCPWDREQTHQSLRPFLMEEAYEVLEALDLDDPAALAEELGDLLLQIVLHTQIAVDTGEFKMGEVIHQINQKLVRRHPHVFGRVVVNGVEDVATNWEIIKKAEKAARGEPPQTASALDGIPKTLPALAQALTISQRAVKMGFEWPNIEGVLDQLIEEAREITEANNTHDLEAEIGDLLFSAVNLARWRNVDPESALRGTNSRFIRRFKKMEALAAGQKKSLTKMSVEEMEKLWNEAKRDEG
jgi:tetrapyrrole methylase family protein/MazG family protein